VRAAGTSVPASRSYSRTRLMSKPSTDWAAVAATSATSSRSRACISWPVASSSPDSISRWARWSLTSRATPVAPTTSSPSMIGAPDSS